MNKDKVAVLTDSGGDIPKALLERYGIYQIPLRILYRDREYLDGVNISANTVYAMLPVEIPKTSLPDGAMIQSVFDRIKADGYEKALWPRANKEPHGLFGINIYNTDTTDPRIFDYLIAVSSDTEADGEFTSYEVPARTWAVFPCTFETIGKTEAQAITKWLPKFQYKPLNRGYITGRMKSNAPDIEYYGENGLVEVWIAVEKK